MFAKHRCAHIVLFPVLDRIHSDGAYKIDLYAVLVCLVECVQEGHAVSLQMGSVLAIPSVPCDSMGVCFSEVVEGMKNTCADRYRIPCILLRPSYE